MSSSEGAKSIPIPRKESSNGRRRPTADSSDDEEDEFKSAPGSLEKKSFLLHPESPPPQSDASRTSEIASPVDERDAKPEDYQLRSFPFFIDFCRHYLSVVDYSSTPNLS